MEVAGGDPIAQRALMTRLLWRLMPLLILCMVVSNLDKANIGFAKLGMIEDLHFGEAVLGFGSSLFYVGYVLFEVPSAMANHRYGARLWFARIMITWSITTLLLAFTRSPGLFYIMRFLLGAAEAGLYPAMIFYLTLWFPDAERGRAMGGLTLGSALGNGLSAIISGSLLELDGSLGLAGWQWIFVVTGIIPIFATILVLRYLPSRPQDARFLSDDERRSIHLLTGAQAGPSHGTSVLAAILRPRVIGFGLLYAIFLGSLYGINYWTPTVFRDLGVTGSANGLVSAIPWAVDAVALMIIMPRLRTQRAIGAASIILAVVGMISFGAAGTFGGLPFKAIALLVGIPAVSLGIACFWTIPVRYFSGAEAAAAIGSISMIGNLGGVATLNLMPALAAHTGSAATALWIPSLGLMIIAVWACWRWRTARAG